MRRLGITTLVASAAVAALAAGSASGGAAVTNLKFTGAYAGTAVVKVADDIADIAATGPGTNTVMKAGKITGAGKGDASAQPCVPFNGTGSITGAKGVKINFTMLSGAQGCGDEQGELFSVSGRAKITSGVGKLRVGTKIYTLTRAKGTFKLTGTYDHTKGAFALKVIGTLIV